MAATPAAMLTDDGQDVVDQQRRGGDQAGMRAEVLLGDDVGAAAARDRRGSSADTRTPRSRASSAMTAPIGVTSLSAATPPTSRTRRISSVAYATDESASEESTASPVTVEKRS